MEDEIRQRIDAFNELLKQFNFPYRVDIVDPLILKAAPKNARFMSGQMLEQLVSNIKRDGGLTSAPFCWRDGQGVTHILSGHHRVKAAIEAGEKWIMILYTDRNLSKQERIAIQLSHNAISGQDEPTILRELWNEIVALDLKAYSGLDDAVLQSYAPVKIDSLGEQDVVFREVALAFFPSEIERLEEVLEKLKIRRKKRYAAQLEQFDRFIDRLMDFKEATDIYNSGTAMLAILDIVEEWLSNHHDQGGDLEVSNGEA